MQQPPPPFAAAPAGWPVRILAFGDFGDGSDSQKHVAASMLSYHTRQRFDFAITLGDNFYSTGMASPDDERWKTWWSDLYHPLRIPFYATLGNHTGSAEQSRCGNPVLATQPELANARGLLHLHRRRRAVLCARYRCDFGETAALAEGCARCQQGALEVVYGHHPIYSEGAHEDNNTKIEQLLPLLRDRAHIYLAGHDHDMQHLKPEGQLHFFVAGSGGKLRPIEPGPGHCLRRAPTASPYWRCSVSPSRSHSSTSRAGALSLRPAAGKQLLRCKPAHTPRVPRTELW